MRKLGDFPDLAVPLAQNRSLIFGAHPQHLKKNLSYITLQDVCDPRRGHTPGRVAQSISSFDQSEDQLHWKLTLEHHRLTAYECLLLCNNGFFLNILNKTQSSLDKDEQSQLMAIGTIQKRLGLSDTKHLHLVQKLNAVLEHADTCCVSTSCHLRFYLLHSLLYERQVAESASQTHHKPRAPSPRKPDAGNADGVETIETEPGPQDGPNTEELEMLDLSNQEFRHMAVLANCIRAMVSYHLPGHLVERAHQFTRIESASTCRSHRDDDAFCERAITQGINNTADLHAVVQSIGVSLRTIHSCLLDYARNSSKETQKKLKEALAVPEKALLAVYQYCVNFLPALSSIPLALFPTPPSGSDHANSVRGKSFAEKPTSQASESASQPQLEIGASSSQSSEQPQAMESKALPGSGHVPANNLPYFYPLNCNLYTALIGTFFVETDEDSSRTQQPRQKKMAKHDQLWRSRRQEARMKEVVDMLSSFRAAYNISNFLHACCFVYAVTCRYIDGTLSNEEMYRLLLVDCYFYPGFQTFCEVVNLSQEEEDCRNDILNLMLRELIVRLSDYHYQYPDNPDDVLFLVKLYMTISIPRELRYQNERRERAQRRREERQKERMSMKMQFVLDGNPSYEAIDVEGVDGEREREFADEDSEDINTLNQTLDHLSNVFNEDVLRVVKQAMLNGGIKECRNLAPCKSIAVYTELCCTIINSTFKHYLRLKAKLLHATQDISPTDNFLEPCPGATLESLSARSDDVLKPSPSYQQQSIMLPLTVSQLVSLTEVLLFECHSECRHYLPSFSVAIPSAVTLALNHYVALLTNDIRSTLQTITISDAKDNTKDSMPNPMSSPRSVAASTDYLHSLCETGESNEVMMDGHDTVASSSPVTQPMDMVEAVSNHSPAIGLADKHKGSETPSRPVPTIVTETDDLSMPNLPSMCPSPETPREKTPFSPTSVHSTASCSSRGTMISVFDVISLSLLNTNFVYISLLLSILQSNCSTYYNSQARNHAKGGLNTPPEGSSGKSSFKLNNPLGSFLKEARKKKDSLGLKSGAPSVETDLDDQDRSPVEEKEFSLLGELNSTHASDKSIRGEAHPKGQATIPSASGSVASDHVPLPHLPQFSRSFSGAYAQSDDHSSTGKTTGGHSQMHKPGGGIKYQVNLILSDLIMTIQSRWRGAMVYSTEQYLERLVKFEDWLPVLDDKEPISSSAVDLAHLLNRMLIVVKYGIQNALEAFKKGYHTTSLHPNSSVKPPDVTEIERDFFLATGTAIKCFSSVCTDLCSIFYQQYCNAILKPLLCLRDRNSSSSLTFYPYKHHQLISSCTELVIYTKINNMGFLRTKIASLEILIAGYSQPSCPQSPILSPGSASTNVSTITSYNETVTCGILTDEAHATGKATLEALLTQYCYKIIGQDMGPRFNRLYSYKTRSRSIESILHQLHPILLNAHTHLRSSCEVGLLEYALRHMAHCLLCVVVRGKVKTTDRNGIFGAVMEDLVILRQYFSNRGEDHNYPVLDKETVESLTNQVVAAAIMLIAKQPEADVQLAVMRNVQCGIEPGFAVSRYTINSLVDHLPHAGDAVHDVLIAYRRGLLEASIKEREERKAREGEDVGGTDCYSEGNGATDQCEFDEAGKGRKISKMCVVM